jgi:hypothetical protein
MRSTEMQRRALAARDANAASRDLNRLIDDATRTTHAAELEAIGLASALPSNGDSYDLANGGRASAVAEG